MVSSHLNRAIAPSSSLPGLLPAEVTVSPHRLNACANSYFISATDFWAGLANIQGYVPTASRGRVTGTASGIPSDLAAYQVVGFSNSVAQYWCVDIHSVFSN